MARLARVAEEAARTSRVALLPFRPSRCSTSLSAKNLPNNPLTWGDRLRQRRMYLGYTRETLAARLGRTARAVADWELGIRVPLMSSWGVIGRVLGEDFLPEGSEIGSRLRSASGGRAQ